CNCNRRVVPRGDEPGSGSGPPHPVLWARNRSWIFLDPQDRFHPPPPLAMVSLPACRNWRSTGGVSRIRILLIGVSGMLNEIVSAAIALEPDMTIVDSLLRRDEGLGAFTRQRRIDV